jgi:hypothetical protein
MTSLWYFVIAIQTKTDLKMRLPWITWVTPKSDDQCQEREGKERRNAQRTN